MTARRSNHEGSISERKDGRWTGRVQWVDELGRTRRSQVYGKTQKEAREKLAEITRRLDRGLPGTDAKTALDGYTQHWIGTTLANSERKASTKNAYGILARNHIVGSHLGAMPLNKIKPSHVEGWVAGLRGKKLSQSSVRQVYTVLRAVLDSAVRDGLLAKNPAASVSRPRVDRHEAAFLEPAQVTALLAAAESTRYQPLFALLVRTGLRRGEALALRWADVDMERGNLRVRGTLARVDGELVVTPPKSSSSRRDIAIGVSVVEILRAVRHRQRHERQAAGSKWVDSGHVFTTELGEPADPRNALRALSAAAKRAELESIGLHTLRHTAASAMLGAGIPITVVSRHLGHSSISITVDTYGHVAPDVSRAAAEALAAAFA